MSRSDTAGVALDFLFVQLQPDHATVDTTPNCGNMLAAVVPFALERTARLIMRGDKAAVEKLSRFGVATLHEAQGRVGLMKP